MVIYIAIVADSVASNIMTTFAPKFVEEGTDCCCLPVLTVCRLEPVFSLFCSLVFCVVLVRPWSPKGVERFVGRHHDRPLSNGSPHSHRPCLVGGIDTLSHMEPHAC